VRETGWVAGLSRTPTWANQWHDIWTDSSGVQQKDTVWERQGPVKSGPKSFNASHCRIVGASSFLYRGRSGAERIPFLCFTASRVTTPSICFLSLGSLNPFIVLGSEISVYTLKIIYGLDKSLKHVPSKDFEVNKNRNLWRSSHTLPCILHIDHIISFLRMW